MRETILIYLSVPLSNRHCTSPTSVLHYASSHLPPIRRNGDLPHSVQGQQIELIKIPFYHYCEFAVLQPMASTGKGDYKTNMSASAKYATATNTFLSYWIPDAGLSYVRCCLCLGPVFCGSGVMLIQLMHAFTSVNCLPDPPSVILSDVVPPAVAPL